jgi:ATP-dependent protease ClpP protease subunit
MQRIDIRGFLDDDLAHGVVNSIRAAAGPVDLRINSHGGKLGCAIQIMLAMEDHDEIVFTTVTGQGNSAAGLVSAAGDVRRIDKRGLMLVHCPSPACPDTAADVRRAICEYTKQLPRYVAEWMAREKTFAADEAKAAGLVDRIIDTDAAETVSLWTPRKRPPAEWLKGYREIFEEFDLRTPFETAA